MILFLPEELMSKAIRCETLGDQWEGTETVCWDRSNAIKVLNHLDGTAISVIGGRVIAYHDGYGEYALGYNWSCESKRNESRDQYAARSRQESIKYITRVKPHVKGKIYFILEFLAMKLI